MSERLHPLHLREAREPWATPEAPDAAMVTALGATAARKTGAEFTWKEK